ncbi:type VI secretion system tip protein TssI/VgrG [Paraburkholderia sp.]|uniref:type VI secretion system Vgr family protein n=1 Tax=Paraburkholderia sp. TaxID=1926495 RepID=UPI002384B2F3|nr:type VI secretion system tip protein TssI/VgrG [Paraburkholderia sp.]MDE1183229.1 type VI secretion system tip protein TssI/VgrG [Paraburkholderia sp.]
MTHLITADTPLAPDTLMFRSLAGSETLSSVYAFDVQMVSASAALDLNALLGKPVTLRITTLNGATRFLGGQIVRCELSGRETSTSRSYIYTLTLRPWLWYLTRTSDCRIFQNRSVVEILREVFGKYGFAVEERLLTQYRRWDYCVQFQETDFAFVSRLMEHEGIYYFFRHEADQQVLILADDISAHTSLAAHESVPYLSPDRLALPGEEGIDAWRPSAEICTGAYVVDDYDFRKPLADLSQRRSNPLCAEHGHYAAYQWQGCYIEADQGEHCARIRLEQEQAGHARVHAHSRVRETAPGYRFTLRNCPRDSENREHLIVGVTYRLQAGGYASGSSEAQYDFDLIAQPSSIPYRAPGVTPIPKATGPQTAIVVGPTGQEIWTDQYGRVKLQFRWDRYGNNDENSSCWVRVSDTWAGSNFGSLHVPRIGQEVVVDFLNGELDRPLITGRVYNASQMPPFGLPASATQSGFVTRTPGGSGANANMLRFEDKSGAEQLLMHAERNYDVSVERHATHTVGGDQKTDIAQNSTTSIGASQTTEIAEDSNITVSGTETLTINHEVALVVNAQTVTGSVIGVTGSAIAMTGSDVSMTGSAISMVGSEVGMTGSSVSVTGISVHHVGLSVTF